MAPQSLGQFPHSIERQEIFKVFCAILHDIDAICVKPPKGDLMAEQMYLTPFDVAKHLQLNERTVTQWLRNGHLRGFKIGKEWRVSELDLDAFIEASANMPGGLPPRSVA